MNHTETYNVDDLDLKILKILSDDGRKNKSTIAGEVERSPNTVIKRISNLEEHGIIKNYGTQINYEKIGYDIIALIELTISKGKMLEIEQDLAKNPNIFAVYDITGEYDALILARFRNREYLSKMIKEIHKSPYVERTNTHFVLNVIKEHSSLKDLLKNE
jgi:Lrp/AsnC family transcriptional regulator for asnA, asnC and gidA